MKRILYLTDQGLTAFIVQGRRLLGKRHYGLGEADLDAFDRDLRQAPEILTRLVLDITEEEFHEEKVPHVFSHDQKRILERRRRQRFRGGRWSYHERQGREKQGRRDDLFLLAGITREEVLRPWLDRLLERCVPLDRMVSVPLLAPRLYRMLRLRQEYVLFVSHGEEGGIRQTFLANGRLKASRLAPTPRHAESEYAEQILTEVRRMKQFLNSAYLLPFGETLHLYVLGSNEVNSLLGKEVSDEDGIRLHNYNLQAIESRFHFEGGRRCDHADAFFSLLASVGRDLPSYATPAEKRCLYHFRARQLLSAATAAVMVAGVTMTAWKLVHMVEQQEELQQLQQETARYQAKRERLNSDRPAGEVSGFLMRDAVEFKRKLEKLGASPFDYFPAVGQTLLRHPKIRLRHLDYRLERALPKAAPDTAPAGGLAPVEVATARPPRPVLLLEGEIDAQGRTYRQIHQDFTQWLQALREREGFSGIRVERWPLEIRADRSLVMEETLVRGSRPLRFSLALSGRELL